MSISFVACTIRARWPTFAPYCIHLHLPAPSPLSVHSSPPLPFTAHRIHAQNLLPNYSLHRSASPTSTSASKPNANKQTTTTTTTNDERRRRRRRTTNVTNVSNVGSPSRIRTRHVHKMYNVTVHRTIYVHTRTDSICAMYLQVYMACTLYVRVHEMYDVFVYKLCTLSLCTLPGVTHSHHHLPHHVLPRKTTMLGNATLPHCYYGLPPLPLPRCCGALVPRCCGVVVSLRSRCCLVVCGVLMWCGCVVVLLWCAGFHE